MSASISTARASTTKRKAKGGKAAEIVAYRERQKAENPPKAEQPRKPTFAFRYMRLEAWLANQGISIDANDWYQIDENRDITHTWYDRDNKCRTDIIREMPDELDSFRFTFDAHMEWDDDIDTKTGYYVGGHEDIQRLRELHQSYDDIAREIWRLLRDT